MPAFYATLYPIALVRALLHDVAKRHPPLPWPACLSPSPPISPGRLDRLPVYLNRTFEFLPDRLSQPRWRNRCQFIGLEPLHQALAKPRKVVIAFAHFGPIGLLRNWLRAGGVPAALLVGGEAHSRSPMLRQKDRWTLYPHIPTAFYQDQLPAAIRHLHAGYPLAMAVDVDTGRQVNVPTRNGWSFRMATGPLRLARKHQATLFGCALAPVGNWRFELAITAPIPPTALQAEDREVGMHLLSQLLPLWMRHPSQWTHTLCERFLAPSPASHP